MMTFEALALHCAPAIAFDLLAALVSVESGFDPLAVVVGPQHVQAESVGQGVALVVGATDKGRPVGIGLAGVDEARLAGIGVSIAEVFEPCANLAAAERLLRGSFKAAETLGASAGAAERSAIRAWWRFDGRFQSDDSFELAVRAERRRADVFAKTTIRGTIAPERRPANSATAPAGLAVAAPTARERAPAPWDVFGRSVRAGGLFVYSKPEAKEAKR